MPKGESNKFVYDGVPGTHQWYDGTQHPWEFKRVWHLEPSLTNPDHVYAGVEDAGLFESKDGCKSWRELSGLRKHDTGPKWQPGAGGMCLHTILLDPKNPNRMFIAISAAGAFRTDDGGKTWKPINHGLAFSIHAGPERRGRSLRASDRDASVAAKHAFHAKALGRHAQRRRRRFLARGERKSTERFWLPDRRSCARAGNDLRRADQERLRALSARRQIARLSQPKRWQRVARAHQRTAATRLLCERVTRRHVGRFARSVRDLFRNDGRTGLCIGRCGGQLESDRERFASCSISGGSNAQMKLRIPSSNIQRNSKHQAPKRFAADVARIGYLNLVFLWSLDVGCWSFEE